ncbi:hypothetical protein BBP40_009262 [Aspergillus hancockii]|nr:hypothetical protein BBP40_009262 [Aspergillus hancockii]
MRPGKDHSLGYLKCRWAYEQLLYRAAERGLPVSIFRASICTPALAREVSLAHSDINRGILVGVYTRGNELDHGRLSGPEHPLCLSQLVARSSPLPVHRIVSPQHTLYRDLPSVMLPRRPLRVVPPREWFATLSTSQDPDIAMHAAVLEEWHTAGWVPFPLDTSDTLLRLCEAGVLPCIVDSCLMQALVIGDGKF